ncbi:MAG TPA: hypothetical protein VJM75_13860 [Acidimicrobiales bacterium]|nr:hypothetical protein [Acidimicrobiales bacterium]
MDSPVAVEVHPNGQVFVNGTFACEVELAPGGAAGGELYRTRNRDELHRDLSLHRIAQVVGERLDELIRYLEAGQSPANPSPPKGLDDKDRVDFGVALVDGLRGQPGELTGRQFYRDGHRTGTTLRALRDRLAEQLVDPAV